MLTPTPNPPSSHPKRPKDRVMRSSGTGNEQGAALVMVLVFISVFGLILGGLLTEAGVSVKYASSVKEHEKLVYAADAGVTTAIQQLHQNNEMCTGAAGVGPGIPGITLNGRDVSVTCSTTSGSTFGASGFAVVATAPSGGGVKALDLSGGNDRKQFYGPVYVAGDVNWYKGADVTNGDVWQFDSGSGCPTAPSLTGANPDLKLIPGAPYGYYCSPVPTPVTPHDPPARPANVDPTPGSSGSCKVFYPGTYTSAPALQKGDNYFVSGVYYFTGIGNWQIDQKATVYGGKPDASYENRKLTAAPTCAQGGLDPANSGTGVEWIFGDNAAGTHSSLTIGNLGHVELFGRQGDAGATGKISIVSVPNEAAWTTVAGYKANSTAKGQQFLTVNSGGSRDLIVHGLVYAPDYVVTLWATQNDIVQTLGGVVAYSLGMFSSSSASNFAVSTEIGSPNPRQVIITSTAAGKNGEKNVISTAVADITNDSLKQVKIVSWRTAAPSDPS